jgi:hypothetical protein
MDSAPRQQPKPAALETTPRLTLSLTGWKNLSAQIAHWPTNAIIFRIKREEDGVDRPCIFKWRPSDLILGLCSASYGEMKEAPVAESQGPAPRQVPDSPSPFPIDGLDVPELWPAAETTLYGTLPKRHGPRLNIVASTRYCGPGAKLHTGPGGQS